MSDLPYRNIYKGISETSIAHRIVFWIVRNTEGYWYRALRDLAVSWAYHVEQHELLKEKSRTSAGQEQSGGEK